MTDHLQALREDHFMDRLREDMDRQIASLEGVLASLKASRAELGDGMTGATQSHHAATTATGLGLRAVQHAPGERSRCEPTMLERMQKGEAVTYEAVRDALREMCRREAMAVKTADIARALDVEPQYVRGHLNRCVANGLAERQGSTKATRWQWVEEAVSLSLTTMTTRKPEDWVGGSAGGETEMPWTA